MTLFPGKTMGNKEWQGMGGVVLKKAGRNIHKALRPVCTRLHKDATGADRS
jgi:hypothetical protein